IELVTPQSCCPNGASAVSSVTPGSNSATTIASATMCRACVRTHVSVLRRLRNAPRGNLAPELDRCVQTMRGSAASNAWLRTDKLRPPKGFQLIGVGRARRRALSRALSARPPVDTAVPARRTRDVADAGAVGPHSENVGVAALAGPRRARERDPLPVRRERCRQLLHTAAPRVRQLLQPPSGGADRVGVRGDSRGPAPVRVEADPPSVG